MAFCALSSAKGMDIKMKRIIKNGTIVTGTNQENAAYPSGGFLMREAEIWEKI